MKKVYSVYDKKGCFYSNPFIVDNAIQAVRSFQQAVMDKGTQISMYPDDFALFYFGTFDEDKGTFDLLAVPHHVHEAIEFVQVANVPAQEKQEK